MRSTTPLSPDTAALLTGLVVRVQRSVSCHTLLAFSEVMCINLHLSEIGLRTPSVNPGVKARNRRLQVFVWRFCYHVDMKIKLSDHGAYYHQYHVALCVPCLTTDL